MKETIYGQVIAKANNYLVVPAAGGLKRIIKNEAIRAYERSFTAQCKIHKNLNVNSRFKLLITVFYASTRFDLDNSLKTILDCLQSVHAITNDNLCYYIEAEKKIDRRNPRVEFEIIELEHKLF